MSVRAGRHARITRHAGAEKERVAALRFSNRDRQGDDGVQRRAANLSSTHDRPGVSGYILDHLASSNRERTGFGAGGEDLREMQWF
jgi:hypothetical protein